MNKNKNNIKGTKVIVGDMPIEVAIRKFKQKVDDLGILEDVRKKMHYEKPTTVKKRKQSAARARWLKKLSAQELPKKMY